MEEEKQLDTNEYLRMQIPSHPRYVALTRDTVYRLCRQHGFSAQAAFDMKIICGEALANIIQHAYGNKFDCPVFVEILVYPKYAEIRFQDLGKQTPIHGGLARDLSDYRESGLGIYLISKLSDYHYFDQNRKSGTLLVVKKRIN